MVAAQAAFGHCRTESCRPFFAKVMEDEAKPRTKDEVIALLQETGETWAGFLDKVTEQSLADQITLPPGAVPQVKSRFEMILSVKEHEMHHRAQLMSIERMLGIVPHLTREMEARFAQAQQQQQQQGATS